MELQPIEQAIELSLKKKKFLQDSKVKYLIRAALSGIFVGFGLMIAYRLGEGFFDIQSPATPLMYSIFFGIALISIIYSGAELFTSNTMYFTMSTLKGKTTVKDTLQNWVACYSGNLIGAIFFAILIMYSGLFSSIENSQFLMSTAENKMNVPFLALLFRGILCNWVVCLAVWIPMHVKGDGAKIGVMMLLVFAFVVSGFEHSVANLVTFSLALAVPHPETITILGALYNLIPVTIGNIIGGGLFVGAVYVFLLSSPKKKQQLELKTNEANQLQPDYYRKAKA